MTFLAAAAIADAAQAQRVAVDPFVGATVTWTSNANLAPGSTAESDVLVEVSPGVGLAYEGARLKAFGTLILDGLYYVDRQSYRILPSLDLNGTYEAIPDFLFLGAGIVTYYTAENPFGLRSIDRTTNNLFTTTQYRISPYIESTLGDNVRYGVRSDNVWTHNSGADSALTSDGYYTLNRAYIERTPLPLGGGLSIEYQKSDYEDSSREGLTQTLARAAVRLGFAASSWIGLRGGHEWVEYAMTDESGAIYGIEFSWTPDSRTSLKGFWEHRFFGSAWEATANWRGNRTALDLRASRQLSTYSEQLFDTPQSNVSKLLDSVLSSQIVDPLERAREVRSIFASRGLAPSLPRAADVYSTQVSLQTDVSATASVSLPRTTAALSGYYRKTVPAPGETPLPVTGIGTVAGLAFTNSEQYGASLTGGYLLSPLLAVSGLAAWTRIESLDLTPAVDATQMSYRLALIRRFAPRTTGNVGIRWQMLRSDVQADTREAAVFVGLLHRF